MALSLIIFLVSDSLIAFKNLQVFLFGDYLFSIIKVLYHAERPFWSLAVINTYQFCLFDFNMPSEKIYNVFFYSIYNVIMYFGKYSEEVKIWVLGSLITLVCLITCLHSFILMVMGLTYLSQELLTVILCILWMVFVINYDNQILEISE